MITGTVIMWVRSESMFSFKKIEDYFAVQYEYLALRQYHQMQHQTSVFSIALPCFSSCSVADLTPIGCVILRKLLRLRFGVPDAVMCDNGPQLTYANCVVF